MDAPTDAAADPVVARALADDPDARGFARGLYILDRALRQWPARASSDDAWMARADAVAARAVELAKVSEGRGVSRDEADVTAPPTFQDQDSQTERAPTMTESKDQDVSLENLSALTRTSLPPGVSHSVRPSMAPSITDAVDETDSGVVDIKRLSAMAREEAERLSRAPELSAARAEAKPEAKGDVEAKSDAKPAAKNGASTTAKKDDVMVTPARSAVPADVAPPPRRGNTWMGLVGGVVASAAAFFVYTQTQSSSPTDVSSTAPADQPAAVESPAQSAPGSGAVEAERGAAPTPQAVAQPTFAAAPPPPPAPPAPAAEPAPAPAPVPAPVEAPTTIAAAAAPRAHAVTETAHARVAPAAPAPTAAHRAAEPAAPPPTAAAPVAPAAPATNAAAAPRGGATGAAQGAAAPSRAASVSDLLDRVVGAQAPAAAPAAAAPTTELPERLNRAQITGVLGPLNGAVRACAQGQTGTAPVAMVIGNDGAVRTATVSGQFAGTPIGECIANVVRRAHFPQFHAASQNLMFPYVITPPR